MYNEDFKNKFISDASDSVSYQNFCRIIFSSTEKTEEQYGSDICTFSEEQLAPLLNNIMGLRKSGHIAKMNVLKRYFRYCLEHRYPGAGNAIENVVPDNVEKIKRSTVPNPLGLQRYLNKFFDAEYEQTMSNVYRCYFWLAYAGVNESNIFDIKVTDIDLSYGVVRFNGQEYPIYKEAYAAIRNAMELQSFRYKHDNYSVETYKERVVSNKLMRGVKVRDVESDSATMLRSVKSNIYRIFKLKIKPNSGIYPLSFSHAALSGLFYRKYELEDKYPHPYTLEDFLDAASDAMYKTHKDTVPEAELRRKRKKIAQSLLDDYESWKCAFNL